LAGEPPLEHADVGVGGEGLCRVLEGELRLRLQQFFVDVRVRLKLERLVGWTLKNSCLKTF
jgi:hypothetical protein